MARSLRWIIVLAAGWEPPEEEKAQFVAEVIETKGLAKPDDCFYFPTNYAQDSNLNIFEQLENSALAVSFYCIPSSMPQENQILAYLSSEMPAVFQHTTSNIQWDRHYHTTKGCEVLILFFTLLEKTSSGTASPATATPMSISPGAFPYSPAAAGNRKMVQQIKATGRPDKIEQTQTRKGLSPIRKSSTVDPAEKQPNPPTPFPMEKANLAANPATPFPFPKTANPPTPFPKERTKIEPTALHPATPPATPQPLTNIEIEKTERVAPGKGVSEKAAPGKGKESEDWNSFLQGLDNDLHEPATPQETPEPPAPKEQPSKTQVHRFPKLSGQKSTVPDASQGTRDSSPLTPPPQPPAGGKPEEFGDWSSFLNQLDSEVAPDAAGEHAASPVPPAVVGNSHENEEPKSDTRTFQGRGLFLTAEELALEKALKKHEQKKEKATPTTGIATVSKKATPPGIPSLSKKAVDPSFATTQKKPTLSRLDDGGERHKPAHTETRKLHAVSDKASNYTDTRKLAIQTPGAEETVPSEEAVADIKRKPPTSAPLHNQPVEAKETKPTPGHRRRSRAGLLVSIFLLLIIAAGGGAAFFYQQEALAFWQKLMGKESQPAKLDNVEEYEKKYQAALQNLSDTALLSNYLDAVNTVIAQHGIHAAQADKAKSHKKVALDKATKFLEDKVTELLNTKYQFLPAFQLTEKYSQLEPWKASAKNLQANIVQIATTTAEETSLTAVGSIIAAGAFGKAVETFRTFNQHQIPQIQPRLKDLEGKLLKFFLIKYDQENQHKEGVRILLKFIEQGNVPPYVDHTNLKTAKHVLWLIHRHILQLTRKNQYQLAQQELKSYDSELNRNDPIIKASNIFAILKRFQDHIREEKLVWEQLCAGLSKLGKYSKPYPLEYMKDGKIEKIQGKIVVTQDVVNTGRFQIPTNTEPVALNINLLTVSIQQKLLKVSGDSPPLQQAYRYGLYLFSQKKLEEAKIQFSKAGFLQEFDEKLEYYN